MIEQRHKELAIFVLTWLILAGLVTFIDTTLNVNLLYVHSLHTHLATDFVHTYVHTYPMIQGVVLKTFYHLLVLLCY